MMETVNQPEPRDASWPRYSDRPFTPYRYIPRQTPHPYRDRDGHSFGRGFPDAQAFPPEEWRSAPEYLLGIDFYNFAYWWEAHEILEEIWHRVGHRTEQGQFLQGLIQVAAGFLHRFGGRTRQFHLQVERGRTRLVGTPNFYMGMDVAGFVEALDAVIKNPSQRYPLIRLHVDTYL